MHELTVHKGGENAFLGITSPREVPVDRLEVREAIRRRRAREGGPT